MVCVYINWDRLPCFTHGGKKKMSYRFFLKVGFTTGSFNN